MVSAALPAVATRGILAFSHIFTWISSAIVVGITGYFLNNYPHGQHLIFEMVISALVLGFWLPALVVPFLSKYKHWYAPLNFIFSYLWIAAFIFSAQDYNESDCKLNAPFGGSCSLKLANEAFIFLAFFFTLVALIIDVATWGAAAKAVEPVVPQKEVRPSGDTAA